MLRNHLHKQGCAEKKMFEVFDSNHSLLQIKHFHWHLNNKPYRQGWPIGLDRTNVDWMDRIELNKTVWVELDQMEL